METKHAYLLSGSAGHSLSPVMHNAAFGELGLDARYEALSVTQDELPEVVARLREGNVYGANVTIPHKLAVIPLIDNLTPEAQSVGAVNTILNRGGELTGHNTDLTGFLRALREDSGYDPESRDVVMLGAGGSARAVGLALLRVGATLGIANRTQSRAEALARSLERYGHVAAIRPFDLGRAVQRASLLVNTTSAGHETHGAGQLPLPHGFLPREMVVDIIYRPVKTPLLVAAEAAGLRTQNGLPMLVYQGAEAFERWTGQPAPIEVMFRALRGAL
ncbi:MAG: Shikimate 5-dehydrogenase I alpha [uncultured Truepera sp.]|uniref:Shikimate dehydrogenase (NADP(+)) n=1 Tax=uncultured Truepera sp. TaxID=543023 RepID=A0A6J4V3P2_9DEIN|nr:MAG: Shikimate 5-dehydrogenase I alpha [uncultured Truepera sp.]